MTRAARFLTLPAALLALAIATPNPALGCGGYGAFGQPQSCRQPSPRTPEEFRALGPAGLVRMLARYDADPGNAELAAQVDQVAGQRDATVSRLYWYTDLEQAKSVAAKEGKPIVYLRLLGKLTDEYSCANSRFFRTVLYADPAVADYLRQNVVLCWGSERPVPVVTIDYGDGRVLKRTITGNSAHYVLTADGRVVDVAPGLMSAPMFLRIVREAAGVATGSPSAEALRAYALNQQEKTLGWMLQSDAAGQSTEQPERLVAREGRPDAADAAPRAEGKMMVEAPILVGVSREAEAKLGAGRDPARPPTAMAAAPLAKGKGRVERPMLQALSIPAPANAQGPKPVAPHGTPRIDLAGECTLSAASVELIRRQNPGTLADPAALARTVEQFEALVAADTLRNVFQFRPEILGWLAAGTTRDLEAVNGRVYGELFLTPREDPWLGLVPVDTYSALEGDGCQVAQAPRP